MIRHRTRGMTFVEVMMAVVVLGFGLVVVIRSFITIIGAIQKGGDVEKVSYAMEERMEQMKQDARETGGSVLGVTSDNLTIGGRVFPYTVTVEPSTVDETLNTVTMRSSWKSGAADRNLSVAVYMANRTE